MADKFQPILEGPSNTQATVAEKVYRNDAIDFTGFLDTAAEGLDLYSNIQRKNAALKESEDKALKTNIMNQYASEISSLKSAYDQGKITSLSELEIATRKVTDKYYQQNIVGAKDLNSIRDSTIGVDVSGKLLEQDFTRQWNQEERVRKQREKLVDNYKKETDQARISDEYALTQMQRITEYNSQIISTLTSFESAKTTNDEALVEGARQDVVKAVSGLDKLLITQGFSKNFQGMLTTEAYEQTKNELINFNMTKGMSFGDAEWAADEALKAVGYKQALDRQMESMKNLQVSQENINKALMTDAKYRVGMTLPQVLNLAALEEFAPGTMPQLVADKLMDSETVAMLTKFVEGTPVDNTGNVKGTQASSIYLRSLIAGYRAGKTDNVNLITNAALGCYNNESLPVDPETIKQNTEGVKKNNDVAADVAFDPKYTKEVNETGSIEDKEKTKALQKQVMQSTGSLFKHFKADSAWGEHTRYDPNKGYIVVTSDVWSFYNALATPQNVNNLDQINALFDYIRGANNLLPYEKDRYIQELLQWADVKTLGEDESISPTASWLAQPTNIKDIGEQFTGAYKTAYEYLTEGNKVTAAALSPVSDTVEGLTTAALQAKEGDTDKALRTARDALPEAITAPAEAVTEGVLNYLDPEYTGPVEESAKTIVDALPEELKKDAKEVFNTVLSTDTPVMIELKKMAANPLIEFGKTIIKNPFMSSEEWNEKYGKNGVVTKAYKNAWEDVKQGVKVIAEWIGDTTEEETEIAEGMALRKIHRQQEERTKKLIKELKGKKKKGA